MKPRVPHGGAASLARCTHAKWCACQRWPLASSHQLIIIVIEHTQTAIQQLHSHSWPFVHGCSLEVFLLAPVSP